MQISIEESIRNSNVSAECILEVKKKKARKYNNFSLIFDIESMYIIREKYR